MYRPFFIAERGDPAPAEAKAHAACVDSEAAGAVRGTCAYLLAQGSTARAGVRAHLAAGSRIACACVTGH